MKAKLTLNSPIWDNPKRKAILKKVVWTSAEELEKKIKETIEQSVPTGRLYRRGAITAKSSRQLLAAGFQRKAGTKSRVVVGSRIHRASARNQAPASDSGALLRSIKVKPTAELQITVSSNLKYAEILDNPNKLNRPFMRKNRDNYRRKFKQNLLDAIKDAIKK